MRRFASGLPVLATALACWCCFEASAAGPPPKPLSRAEVVRLMAELGGKDPDAREAAAPCIRRQSDA
jgi:hypothetical protein